MPKILTPDKNVLDACRNATLQSFKGKVDPDDLNRLLNCMPSSKPLVHNNRPVASAKSSSNSSRTIEAEASLVSAVLWSKVSCTPKDLPWKFEESAWGPGIGGGSCIGFMYHAYENDGAWDTFFREVTAYHAQGIAATGGIFQINWFNSSGVPIGQFNGVLAGAGAFEIGGSGKWKSK